MTAVIQNDPEYDRLKAEFDAAFAALRVAGVEHDADHPAAARYREASNAVNHYARKAEARILAARERRYLFNPDGLPLVGAEVTVVRPLTAEDADLAETGPMWRVRTDDGQEHDAFADELAPLDPAFESLHADAIDYGPAWDTAGSASRQHFIETGTYLLAAETADQ